MDIFTLQETGQLLRALEKMLQDNVEDRLVTIMDECRGMADTQRLQKQWRKSSRREPKGRECVMETGSCHF